MKKNTIAKILKTIPSNQKIQINGWIKTFRSNRFIALNDGSCLQNIQCVLDFENTSQDILKRISTGAAIWVEGILVASSGKGQNVEIQIQNIKILGDSDANTYPIQPKKHSLEFLRQHAHLRFRTNLFGAIMRVRHNLFYAVHKYFNDNGFLNISTPIITGSDCEGAGEMFNISTLDKKNIPLNESGNVDYTKDFFGKPTHLTVSGQLEAETAAMALGKVYTFGPTFRAENSNTSRHLAEFWMIEPEVAFHDLKDNMNLAEDFIKFVIASVLKNCEEDLHFLTQRLENEEKLLPKEKRSSRNLFEKLKFVLNTDFKRVSYTEAVEILKNSKPNKKKKFQYLVEEWGVDLQSEHERYLVEKHFDAPVILYDYPAKIKAFYMKLNEDKKTVKAMDILFPGIGEMVGGAQREENLEILKQRIKEFKIDEKELWWYLDTRKFGSAVHSGFGLGFERLVLFVTGMTNVRDVIPFPRTPQNADF